MVMTLKPSGVNSPGGSAESFLIWDKCKAPLLFQIIFAIFFYG